MGATPFRGRGRDREQRAERASGVHQHLRAHSTRKQRVAGGGGQDDDRQRKGERPVPDLIRRDYRLKRGVFDAALRAKP